MFKNHKLQVQLVTEDLTLSEIQQSVDRLITDIATVTSFTKYNTGAMYVEHSKGLVEIELVRAQNQSYIRYTQYVESLYNIFKNHSIYEVAMVGVEQ